MSKVLRPIQHKDVYTHSIESEILAWMNEAFFTPLLIDLRAFNVPVSTQYQAIKFDEFGKGTDTRSNAIGSAVAEALRSGRIQYANGKFTGRFSAKISKELRGYGATFDTRDNTFNIAQNQIPTEIRASIFESVTNAQALHETIIATLNAMQANIPTAETGLDFSRALTFITTDLDRQLATTTSGLESITVQAKFSPAMRAKMNEQLTHNVNLSIKNFASERIPELRRRVEENVLQGMRSDRLAKMIESEFGVDKRKAEFLADQEAGLVTAKYREVKYSEMGVQEYIWQTANDNRVRAGHRALNGRRFAFTNPPVCDPATGRRCNPGEDYRCRCVPRPIVNFGGIETGAEAA